MLTCAEGLVWLLMVLVPALCCVNGAVGVIAVNVAADVADSRSLVFCLVVLCLILRSFLGECFTGGCGGVLLLLHLVF